MFKKALLLFFVVLLFSLPILAFAWWNWVVLAINSNDKSNKVFVVPQGWGAEEIGNKLTQEGFIKSKLAFKIIVWKLDIGTKLQAGDFRLSKSMDLNSLTQTLTHGTLDVWVIIPEGLRREEIARIISQSFKEQDTNFDVDKFIVESAQKEGELFPDTYLISKGVSPTDVIKIMTDNFENKFKTIQINNTLTRKQIVILASIIEREAKYENDRPIISGILLSRLKKGMPLQVDASIQYAKANALAKKTTPLEKAKFDWWPKPFQDDLKIISPFNTYESIGLPPAPISNPGLSSLKAAASTSETDYLFYLSDESGKMYYSKTYKEHQNNIDQYLSP